MRWKPAAVGSGVCAAALFLAAPLELNIPAFAAILAACFLLIRLLRRRGMTAGWAAVYAWHPLAVVEFAAAGHLDSLMILGVLAGLDLWESGRREAAALAWSWLAGFLYLGVDARLRAITFGLPLWSWLCLAQYAFVYGLLAWSLLSRRRQDRMPAVADACRGVLLNRRAAWGFR